MARLGWSFLTWVRYSGIFYIQFQSKNIKFQSPQWSVFFIFWFDIILAKKGINELNSEIGLLFILIYYESHSISRSTFHLNGLRYIFFAEAQTNPLIIWMMVNYNFLCLLNDKSLINGCMAATIVLYIQTKMIRKSSSWFKSRSVLFRVESELFSPL